MQTLTATPFPEHPTTSTAPVGIMETTPAPTVGSIVNFVLDSGRHISEVRPAIVVKTWTPTLVQLQVFTDNTNDFGSDHTGSGGIMWRASVRYSEIKEPGTWHWPSQA